ncbi:hypothetical protein M9H77_19169 [Catharanthus roseus]|uniref:Uncharacterized protein n=1 Tax=Catharanthus roseus TaxID=4058 RepID=A0ACC0B9I6_CATRO|nr:hypothetical protein M9H77_19169 [Catharanthus roseus]
MKTSFRPGLKFVENQVKGRVSGLHRTWLVPGTRASFDDVDGFLTLRVDPLEEGRGPWMVWPNQSTWTPHHALRLARNGQGPSKPLKVVYYCETYNLVPRGMQMLYSAVVDLVAGLGASQTYKEGILVDEPSRTTLSSSSYSLKKIVPKREPIPVIDLSDDESVEG